MENLFKAQDKWPATDVYYLNTDKWLILTFFRPNHTPSIKIVQLLMFSLNCLKILNSSSLGCEVLLCGELLFDEREMLYLLIFFAFYRRLCLCDFIWSPWKLPRLYSGNVITQLSVIFFEKMASCDLHSTVCDFTRI